MATEVQGSSGMVHEIADLTAVPVVVNGQILAPDRFEVIPPPAPYKADTLVLSSLSAIEAYVEKNVDELQLSDLMLIVSEDRVVLVNHLGAADAVEQRRREAFVGAQYHTAPFGWGGFMEAEAFMIALQTRFVKTPARDELLKLLGSIRGSDVVDSADDGVTQEVSVVRGAAIKERAAIQNPVRLRPIRTFTEVEQPESPFVLRVRGGGPNLPTIALFEADGGAWKAEAVKNVAKWLREHVAEVAVIG